MCTSNNFPGALLPYGLKLQGPVPGLGAPYPPNMPPGAALELQRSQAAQLYDYGARIRLGLHYAAAAAGQGASFPPYHPNPHDPFGLMYAKHCDPRIRFLHEEPKPSHSYIGLIAMGILSNKDQKMVLSDIYQWILDNYAYFRTRGPGWRNSIRHNLSLNDCFIKSGRSANGKGHYWAIHPANVEDFKKGDFRRRRAQRKVRKAMGLAVPDDEDSPSPPPPADGAPLHWAARVLGEDQDRSPEDPRPHVGEEQETSPGALRVPRPADSDGPPPAKKRLFDVDSLLAPDTDTKRRVKDTVGLFNPLLAASPHFLHPHMRFDAQSDLQKLAAAQHHPFSFANLAAAATSRLGREMAPQHTLKEMTAPEKVEADSDQEPEIITTDDNASGNKDSGDKSNDSLNVGDRSMSPDSVKSASPPPSATLHDVHRRPPTFPAGWLPMVPRGLWSDRPSAFRNTLAAAHGLPPPSTGAAWPVKTAPAAQNNDASPPAARTVVSPALR